VPLGLVFDKQQNLYISCFASGAIYQVDNNGNKKLYVQLPAKPEGYFQYLAFDKAGNLYCPSYAHNCIYKIDRNRTVSKLVITGENGEIVKLHGPNSIFIRNDTLYFTEISTSTLNYIPLPVSSPASHASVSTIRVNGLNGPNGMAIDNAGSIYIANEPGKNVICVQENGSEKIVLHCDSPNGLDFDDKGALYISNFFSGIILKWSKQSTDTFAAGLSKPADIKFGKEGNLYVAEFENGSIKIISPQGEIKEFASGFQNPFGIAFDTSGNLYVANNRTGIVNKVSPSGKVSIFAQIPGATTYLAYSKKTGVLYATCFTCHGVYALVDGKATLIGGTGKPGYRDGALKESQFNGPNSIVLSEKGELYISEFSANRIRKINYVE
jgi:sugar lactone lactonase YvrE